MEKYLRDVRAFAAYAARAPITKELVLAYKAHLLESGYAIRSINSMLASLHSFFRFASWSDCRVKVLRQQQQTYCPEEKELTRAEYLRLLHAAGQDSQLRLVMQTICATGIRVSELRSFTAEAVRQNAVTVRCKGKTRTILLPEKLRRLLLDYVKKHRITSGPIFLNSCGAPLDRRTIWARMKALCRDADVPTFFLQFYPDLVKTGHVYILQTPLFRVRNKQKTIYCYTEEERINAINTISNAEITRFKGLGEISPDEFRNFIGKDMRLDPVILDRDFPSAEVLRFYMGANTVDRQKFVLYNLRVDNE